MDYDGDGIPDVLSGSYPGELYLFHGTGKGQFDKPEVIKDVTGKPLKVGSASTIHAADWFGTGKLDLILSNIDGQIFVVSNQGTRTDPVYGNPQKLPIKGPEAGDAHAIVADWENSGLPGLMIGWGDGSVQWFRNSGSKTEPKLDAPVTLLPPAKEDESGKNASDKDAPRGIRAKLCVLDWNGDGLPDLLVGDYVNSGGSTHGRVWYYQRQPAK